MAVSTWKNLNVENMLIQMTQIVSIKIEVFSVVDLHVYLFNII